MNDDTEDDGGKQEGTNIDELMEEMKLDDEKDEEMKEEGERPDQEDENFKSA